MNKLESKQLEEIESISEDLITLISLSRKYSKCIHIYEDERFKEDLLMKVISQMLRDKLNTRFHDVPDNFLDELDKEIKDKEIKKKVGLAKNI